MIAQCPDPETPKPYDLHHHAWCEFLGVLITKGFFPGLCNLFLLLHPFQKSPAEPGFTEVARIGQTDSLKLTALNIFQIISGSF